MKENLRPKHYHNEQTVEPFEIIQKQPLQWQGFCYGNVIKYIQRYSDKNGVEDLHKAKVYMNKLIELIDCEYDVKSIMEGEELLKDIYIVKQDTKAWSGFAYGMVVLNTQSYIHAVKNQTSSEDMVKYIIIAKEFLDELIQIEESNEFESELEEFIQGMDDAPIQDMGDEIPMSPEELFGE